MCRLGWLVGALATIDGVSVWLGRKEFASLRDCLFYSRKQARHPRVGERAIEYPWVYKRVSDLRDCRVLDVGAKRGLPITDLLLEQNIVYTIDSSLPESSVLGRLTALRGDIRQTSFDDGFFDAVVAVSTLEHVGIAGRYDVSVPDEEGDLKAMREIDRILKPGGRVLLTLPYGVGRSLPLNRLYGPDRVTRLVSGFQPVESEYFRYAAQYSLWLSVPEEAARTNNWDAEPWYALACIHLRKGSYGSARA
jgi:SAM-dependent methyltransferase